ncbi:ImmA/IrrE family metallo-endopeptidase [Paenibacillus hunanensis]|uniref:Zn-dependent peptidase ImmA (M78 family) n=1 Tax=Paenibacillus hunanensis TaxID=539262 RepID=A0ABU1IXC3_9BACL|nr:ImmA/IrrE family metallo-endopeptidase [Paenibacillus hunanensis]MCL9659418.1 ImmA/IrrE family metallo-endopeptidase [Paenibacillus hunanensis]MDR6243337.1 Zn-dependent peptidase ImmA (M78 family) [Paenibacillus hunanensis]WPP40461.1 ImmA/IrrE family metallo-endopeptidase [Paenibacillus hunanensis]GGI97018.1 ImmA/IrrE family metallo-endopeptidase [Paenibacillus hunanensis]
MDDIAARLVHQYKTNCPFEIATALGIHIRYMDLGKSTKGLYYAKLRRRFIVINQGLSEQWQRFVCAHELGHDRLHKGLSRFFLEEHSYFWPGKLERQANSFAITLLTTGREQRDDETLEAFAMRTGIPQEMLYFFDV